MRKVLYILCVAICFITMSFKCKKNCAHDKLPIENKSANAIYYLCTDRYSDTNIKSLFPYDKYNPVINDSQKHKIYPDSTKILETWDCMENWGAKKGKLMIFIFDAHTLETHSWQTVIDEKLYLKRYDLSAADLENRGWKFSYH